MLSARVPELSALEVFVTVARVGSINAAAGELHLSQQAVSARIAALERHSGVRLLTRSPQGSRLTEAGAVVCEWATRLLEMAGELDAGLAALRGEARATLRIAASLTVAEYLLPRWLVALDGDGGRRATPVEIDLAVANSDAVIRQVSEGAVEVGFVEGPSVPRRLRSAVVGRDRLVLVVSPGHPWARRRNPLAAAELARTPLVTRELGSGTRDVLVSGLRGAPGPRVAIAPPALALPTTSAIRAAVMAGAGAAVISELAVADDVAAGRLQAVAVAGLELGRAFRAVWSGTARPAGPAQRLIEIAGRRGAR